ncbi:MAG: murein biosynthesis integral membrane protein MurJ [Parachlamydiaceae bacterium]|nr:murein biosynthesis integral membrane protein MurJ [Parachlamydiaceae bacterium]
MSDTIHTIKRSAKSFFCGTMLSRISGMVRDVSMAYVFGTKPSVAAFMIAFRFAHLLRRLFGEGAMQSAFIPEFENLRLQNTQRAFTFFKDLILSVTFFLMLAILISCGLLYGALYYQLFDSSYNEVITLTIIMLPSLLFICLFGLNASLLQCEKHYFIPSFAPVAFNLIWIISVLNLQSMPSDQAMIWLSGVVVLACLFQWLFTFPQIWSILKKNISVQFFKNIHLRSPDLKQLLTPLFLGILGISASQINNAIDPIFAWHANEEGPAFLWYAMRIQQLPLALFGIALSGALLPPLSRALKNNRKAESIPLLQYAFQKTFVFILPLAAILLVLGDIIIGLIYARGDFDIESLVGTTYCLWAYNFGLIPCALILILVPVFYAQSHFKMTTLASFMNLGINIFLNTLFVFHFEWGATSVALATSISAWVNLLFLMNYLNKKDFRLASKQNIQQGVFYFLVTVTATIGTYVFRLFQKHYSVLNPELIFSASPLEKILSLTILTAIFGGIFLLGILIINAVKKPINAET